MLALTTKPILAIGAHYLDIVVSFRHIQPVTRTSREVRQRQGKQSVCIWAGETGLGKQAG